MNEIGIKRVGNWFGTVLEIVLNRGTKAPRSADKSALEKTVSCRARASALAARGLLPWPREGFCPGGRIPKPGLSYGFIPAISLELLFRLAGIHVPAQTIAGMTFFLIPCFSGSKNI
jgi:hypothetical protein